MEKIKVLINGYGVIGKRVADAVLLQNDMELEGVCDVATDWRIRIAVERGYPIYAANSEAQEGMKNAGLNPAGTLAEALGGADVVVDCAPKKFGAQNAALYKSAGVKFIVQGGEKHEITGHSFSAEVNYASAVGRECTRVVSCNTTSILRLMTALKNAGLLKRARGVLMRRATDPWESHLGGIMNTLVPEKDIPSHQGPDAQSVDPDLDVITTAFKVPETLSHVHSWNIQLTRPADKQEVLAALAGSTRVALARIADGLGANNAAKELMSDLGRPRGDMFEVLAWEDQLKVQGDELFLSYIVDNQAIVTPENIDAIRALHGAEPDGARSIAATNDSLGIRSRFP
jgi:glyceraldehyde-3-phosphate dehydrogenase (NAD(P))